LKYYLDVEKGDLIQGLARYNGNVGKRWYADRVLDRLRSMGPVTGNAATGVPHAMASSITRPKVSVRLGKTNTSADDKCWASASPEHRTFGSSAAAG